MKERLKSVGQLMTILLLAGLTACSNSSTSNNQQNTSTSQGLTPANSLTKSSCNRPLEVFLANADYQSKGNYVLTYSWDGVNNATGYEFKFLINGNVALQNLTVTDTFLVFPQAVSATDSINASVIAVCGSEKSDAKLSPEIVYLNTIATDDVVFLVEPSSTIQDICARSCERLKFNSNSMLNSDGTVLTLNSISMQVPYYDFEALKTCLQCNTSGGAPVVDPAVFNSCLNNPLNQYWLYDPNAYTVCP